MTRIENDEYDEEAGGASTLRLALAAVRRFAWIIALTVIGVTGAAIAVCLHLPNSYEASATVQIDQRSKKIANFDGVLSDLKADNPTIDSEVEVIRSKSIALGVIEALSLRDDEEMTASPAFAPLLAWIGLRRPPSVMTVPTARTNRPAVSAPFSGGDDLELVPDDVLQAFAQRLKVSRLRNTLLIEIRFTSADPVKAARIANTVASVYMRSQVRAKQQAAEFASAKLDEAMQGLRQRVAQADRDLERYKADQSIFDADGRLIAEQQLTRDVEALSRARNAAAEARSRYEQVKRLRIDGENTDSINSVLKSGTIQALREDLTRAMRREAELGTKYGDLHPEIQKIRADIAKSKAELHSETAKILRTFLSDAELAEDNERQIEKRLETVKADIGRAKEHQWRLRELEREASSTRQLYESLLARHKQTNETAGLHVPDARVIEQAGIPLHPAAPKRTLIVLAALVLGLCSALAGAIAVEYFKPGFSRPEDVARVLQTPVLATIPILPRRAGDTEPLKRMRLMLADPGSPAAGAIRALRHELDGSAPRQFARTLLVMSANPGEGSTFVAANLALHFAEIGTRTLLIDADFATRSLSHAIALEHRSGLHDALSGDGWPESHIVRDARTGLCILPAGHTAMGQAPSGALSSNALGRLFDRLKTQFDVLIIDAPPIHSGLDARLLADRADQIALVVGWRNKQAGATCRALALLGSNRSKLSGAIINEFDQPTIAVGASYAGYAGGALPRAA